jgi:hypothetical protein
MAVCDYEIYSTGANTCDESLLGQRVTLECDNANPCEEIIVEDPKSFNDCPWVFLMPLNSLCREGP